MHSGRRIKKKSEHFGRPLKNHRRGHGFRALLGVVRHPLLSPRGPYYGCTRDVVYLLISTLILRTCAPYIGTIITTTGVNDICSFIRIQNGTTRRTRALRRENVRRNSVQDGKRFLRNRTRATLPARRHVRRRIARTTNGRSAGIRRRIRARIFVWRQSGNVGKVGHDMARQRNTRRYRGRVYEEKLTRNFYKRNENRAVVTRRHSRCSTPESMRIK